MLIFDAQPRVALVPDRPDSLVMPRFRFTFCLMLIALGLCLPEAAEAARITDLAENNVWEQAVRFFTFSDRLVAVALSGCLLLGLCCGLLGSFIVVRRLALVGDTLSHAVLPGIVLGYLWTLSKSPVHLFFGAMVSGLLGVLVVSLIRQTTKIKQDAALGIVLAGFFAIGSMLLGRAQGMGGDLSGLKSFFFGSAAALSVEDVKLMAVIACISLFIVGFFFAQFKLVAFDPVFAGSIGISPRIFHYVLMMLLAWAVVSGLQAVGVVLVSAMLVIPAATAYLLTERMHWMVVISVIAGMLSAGMGAFVSFLGPALPTGPCIVLSAAAIFAIAFFFAPKTGLVPTRLGRKRQRERIHRENTLKAIYQLIEAERSDAPDSEVWIDQTVLEAKRRRSYGEVLEEIANLERHDLLVHEPDHHRVRLTEEGREQAAGVVRNHRLWELYLTNQADIAADHVHDDAERIEHILGADLVKLLEESLDAPTTDPHGSDIPQVG